MNNFKGKFSNFKTVLVKNRSLFLSFILIFVLGIIAVPRIFAQPQAVKSVEIFSERLDYNEKEPGAWKIDKSAKWVEKGMAEITFDVDTIMKSNTKYTDVLFVLDVSGSMDGEKLNRVKADSIQLIESLLSNDKNKAGLITFDSNSQIVSPLTNNREELVEKINSLTTTGSTNYYKALVNVDSVLKDYVKDSDRECIVLFLTDGYPNEGTPNEEGQYSYLKSQYPFIIINGVQYEMGSTILDPIKKVSDNQYIADMETLNNILFEASITPISYENFEITDYIDTNYFYVNSESDIKVSQGNIMFDKDDQKFTWKMDNLKSGLKAKMSIKAKLKEELNGEGGFYPTNEKEEIKSKIDKDEEEIISLKTPVLSDNYRVIYDGNEPDGCRVEGVPTEKQHTVFDTVAISDSAPKCDGYQFKGWKIVNDNVEKVNDDYFMMPEEDVTLKASWSKLDIKKSMEGTIKEKITLYKQLKQDAENNNHAKKYTGDTSTFNGKEDVYYYYGETPNNNVIFGGFCWKMYRTTDTGGVKMVYNGEPDSEGKCRGNRKNHVGYGNRTIQSFPAYYSYGTDYTYDEVSKIFTLAGDVEQVTWNSTTYPSLIGKYTCRNTTGSCSTLYYVESYSSDSSAYVLSLNSTTNYSFIGSSAFNSRDNSVADVGYMYNKRYTYNSKSNLTSSTTVLSSSSLSTNYYYADEAIWGTPTSNRYNLVDKFKVDSEDQYPNLLGKYTFLSSAESDVSSVSFYITGVDGSKAYFISLIEGKDISSASTSYYFADSLIDDGTGKQTLDPESTKEVKATEWYDSYADYKNKFYCPTPDCTTVYYVTSTSNTSMTHVNVADDYMYGNSFTYDKDTGMYTLSGETQHFYDWPNNYSKLGNTHYTCWNTNGTCQKVSYIYYTFNGNTYYIDLENGISVETLLDEMLYDENINTTNSTIKTLIDAWYSKNMAEYTDYLEDTVWCNDRSISNKSDNGWNPNGGSITTYLNFGNSSDLTCQNKNDRFTVSRENGNGALTYPIGLVTGKEENLTFSSNSSPLSLKRYNYYWSLDPYFFSYHALGHLSNSRGVWFNYSINSSYGVRPAVSLRAGIMYESGNGTADSPYIIDMDS